MEGVFDCKICYNRFNHNSKKPMSLPCGHTFCQDCLKSLHKDRVIRCPLDNQNHYTDVNALPVTYAILTALPSAADQDPQKKGQQKVLLCPKHTQKKIEFFCSSCTEYICSKCILTHVNDSHQVTQCSPHIPEMRQRLSDLLFSFKGIAEETKPITQEFFEKQEKKILMKFDEERERLNKAYKRIFDQLEVQKSNFLELMREQMEKELDVMRCKKHKIKELRKELEKRIGEIDAAIAGIEIFQDNEKFETYFHQKEKEMKTVKTFRDIVRPTPHFVYYRFKDSLRVSDYGTAKEATFKLPSVDKDYRARVYLFGDDTNNRVSLCYDIKHDEWSMKSLDENCKEKFNQCSASIAMNSRQIMITGGGSPPKKDTRIYDILDNEVTLQCSMLEPRNAHAITRCDGVIYVLGGFSGKERLNSVECFVQAETKWIKVQPMKQKRHYLAACSIGNEAIYAFGGFHGSSETEINDSIEKFSVEDEEWTILSFRLKSPLWACSVVPISQNEIMLIGGKNLNRNSEVHLLDLQQRVWKQLPSMNQMRVSHKSFVIEDKVFVIGGDYEMSCEVFDLKNLRWSFISSYSSLISNSTYSFSAALVHSS